MHPYCNQSCEWWSRRKALAATAICEAQLRHPSWIDHHPLVMSQFPRPRALFTARHTTPCALSVRAMTCAGTARFLLYDITHLLGSLSPNDLFHLFYEVNQVHRGYSTDDAAEYEAVCDACVYFDAMTRHLHTMVQLLILPAPQRYA